MKIFNNTPNQVHYGISDSSTGDCGNLEPNETADWPAYDNSENVQIAVSAMPDQPNPAPFSITIPETKTGMAVTIGLFLE
jgi:hypothetical protein